MMEEEKKLNHLNEPIEEENILLEQEAPLENTPDIPEEFEEEPDFGADRLELEDPEETHDDEPEEEEEAPQEKPDYEKEILQLVRSNASPKMMREKLEDYHGKDIAEVLPQLNVTERKKVYRFLDNDMISDIFEYLDEEDAGRYLSEMDPKKAAAVITEIEPDSAVDILRAIPRERRTLLIDLLDEESRNDVRLIASFDEDAAVVHYKATMGIVMYDPSRCISLIPRILQG